MATATLIRDRLPGFTGHAALYRLDPPLKGYTFDDETAPEHALVVVSAASMFEVETYIFPGTEDGKVADWGELPGSTRGTLSHREALANAGYEVA